MPDAPLDPFVRHLEHHLGPVRLLSGATDRAAGRRLPVQLARFDDVPAEGAVTCVSVGVSALTFQLPDASPIRQEVLFAAYRAQVDDHVYAMLFDVCDQLLGRHEPWLHGETLDLEEPLVAGAQVEGLFFYTPVYFPDELALFEGVSPSIFLSWMIPVSRRELELIDADGWERFDELLQELDPDLLDLHRPSMV